VGCGILGGAGTLALSAAGDVPGGGRGGDGAQRGVAGGEGDEPPSHGARLGGQPRNLRHH
jgi:hypothetical protein